MAANHTNLVLFALFITLVLPTLVLTLVRACLDYQGSLSLMYQDMASQGIRPFIINTWKAANIGDPLVCSIIAGFIIMQLILMKLIPGPKYHGPTTVTGYKPEYTDNGFRIFIINLVTFGILSIWLKSFTTYSPSIVYDKFFDISTNLLIFGYFFCLGLYFKGIWSPSKGDFGSSNNVIIDYYWGLELYPRIFGWDVKSFTNCRFGCTLWAILPCCFAMKSYELHGFVDSMFVHLVLLLSYLLKFFWWEAGYMNTLDIILDRAGFYICWGCLCFVTGMYTQVALYLVDHPVQLGPVMALGILAMGFISLGFNYAADWEKQYVRKHDGKCLVWGKLPRLIRANYTTGEGLRKTSLLIASGFWGISRHFHYIPECTLALAWTLPAGFSHLLPYIYFFYLPVLLIHRSLRDEDKCSAKYGKFWQQYCSEVPNKIIPYVF